MKIFPAIPDPPLVEEAGRRWLGAAAMQSIRGGVRGVVGEGPVPSAEAPVRAQLETRTGVFVTLHREGRLCGCVGAAEGTEPIFESVPRLARAAARSDRRFQPVAPRELSALTAEISILGPLILLPNDPPALLTHLDPFLHGIRLSEAGRTAILLPQVARRSIWSAGELLEQSSKKAGLEPGAWRRSDAVIQSFRVLVFDALSGELAP